MSLSNPSRDSHRRKARASKEMQEHDGVSRKLPRSGLVQRRASAAAGSRSDAGAEAGGSRLHALVRRRFWHSIPPSLDTPSFLPLLALTAPCMRTLAPRIMRLLVPPSIPSHLSLHWAASADKPIGLEQHHRGNRESQGFGDLQVNDELNF